MLFHNLSYINSVKPIFAKYMGLPQRITFNDIDYNFTVANTEPITKATVKIPIVINGETIELIKDSKGWITSSENSTISPSLAQAIGRAIELRFRL